MARSIHDSGDESALVAYVMWSKRNCGTSAGVGEVEDDAFTVDRLIRSCGHAFMYTEPVLLGALVKARISEIAEMSRGEPSHSKLRGVDCNQEEIDGRSNELKTLKLDARA